MKVHYTDEAIMEISDLLDYVATENPATAREISIAIEGTVNLLRMQPWISRVVYHGQVRAFPVAGYPYRIFYQIGSSDIVIRNVRHMRRHRPWEGR